MKKNIYAGIAGIGSVVPDKIMTNKDWEALGDTSDEWIVERTGIRERRFADEETAASDLATIAAERALQDAGVVADDIDLVIVATTTPDYPSFPSTAALVQDRIKASKAAAFDLSAACSGFVYGFTTACQFVETGLYQNVLLVCVDLLTKTVDKTDRNTAILFGDGAGAVVVSPTENDFGLLSSDLGARGAGAASLVIPAGGTRTPMTKDLAETSAQYIQMNGREIYKFAVVAVGKTIDLALKKGNLTYKDIDLFVPHQANIRIIEGAMTRMGLPQEKVVINIDKYGNTSSASIPIALDEAYREGRLKKGAIVVTCGFGAGLTWGTCIFRWGK